MGINKQLTAALGAALALSLAACGSRAAKASGGATSSSTSATTGAPVAVASITTVPIQVIQTPQGAVGYRTFGRGSPLVLIMGYSGSQDTWPPSLVDALAQHHQVITFDNAGVGQTAMPSGALTISAMADQTAALTEACT